MELDHIIIGCKLSEIQKKPDDIKLVFDNSRANKSYVLTFKGLLFETSGSTLNKRVKSVQINSTLGFRAISQIRYLNRNPHNYRQLFIQMEGSNDDNKMELIGALRSYKISPKKLSTVNNKKTGNKVIQKNIQKLP